MRNGLSLEITIKGGGKRNSKLTIEINIIIDIYT